MWNPPPPHRTTSHPAPRRPPTHTLLYLAAFPTGSVLAFLVFGPMVDVKSSLMFLGVFQRRAVAYLILLPMLLSMLMGIWWNLNIGW